VRGVSEIVNPLFQIPTVTVANAEDFVFANEQAAIALRVF
jgi:hypothetical protein